MWIHKFPVSLTKQKQEETPPDVDPQIPCLSDRACVWNLKENNQTPVAWLLLGPILHVCLLLFSG